MIMNRRKFFCYASWVGAAAVPFLGLQAEAADYSGVVSCTYCGTGFRVEWHGTDEGYGVYQCPNCHKGSRVHWGRSGIQKAERA
jgi:hypothetical protein